MTGTHDLIVAHVAPVLNRTSSSGWALIESRTPEGDYRHTLMLKGNAMWVSREFMQAVSNHLRVKIRVDLCSPDEFRNRLEATAAG